eukprot:5559869-Alexandrium_andersonii.AAC.1
MWGRSALLALALALGRVATPPPIAPAAAPPVCECRCSCTQPASLEREAGLCVGAMTTALLA